MSNPSIPNITPTISLSIGQTVPLLLSSIALEELALAHLMNAEAEKLQFVLGTLTPTSTTFSPATISLSNLLAVDASVQRTLRDVIKKEMLLEFKFENVLDLIQILTPPLVLLGQQTFTLTGAVVTTTVPAGATTAIIQAIGAQGGLGNGGTVGGRGASLQGEFAVTPGESLAILPGEMGGSGSGGGGGGGGSFVWRGSKPSDLTSLTLLIAAGGGGGAGGNNSGLGNNGADASIFDITNTGPGTTGNPVGGAPGSNGMGGAGGTGVVSSTTRGGGGGGAGVFSDGGDALDRTVGGGGGIRINNDINGGAGGVPGDTGSPGGFGGGGGSGLNGGGGGGYSGGGGGSRIDVVLSASGGGGGGSRNNGTNQVNTAGVGIGDGLVNIFYFGF
ncbi:MULTISPECIES: hypothetical protein [Neobacillus]|uniref:hypothetical protein n=1 Tax=Neobacillus TaxID=2675232 RepID=UPI00201753DF|nr:MULTISPECIES: hypothetical protein [Neobacillus]